MHTPPYLKPNDKIGIIATARKISMEELLPAIIMIKQWGFEPILSENLFNDYNQFSGTDKQRTKDLQTFLDDDSIKAIIIARGGYGTMRIIDSIDFTKFKLKPKWVVGYSDITVLHSHLINIGIESVHGTMPINFTKDKKATESIHKALIGEPLKYNYSYKNKENKHLYKEGNTTAQLVGGNLSLLYAMTGSVSDINMNNKILFIEDLDEYLYHIDRMFLSLKRAGKLSKLAGLVVGGMSEMKDNTIPFGQSAEEIIIFHTKEYTYPVCFDFPAGHIDTNMALIIGRKATLTITATNVTLSFEHGGT